MPEAGLFAARPWAYGAGPMKRFALLACVAAALVGVVACAPIEPKAECAKAANDCDQALDEPFNSFVDTDQTFGTAGTCWTNEDTAAGCVDECNKFVAEQLADAQAANNIGVIVACGGKVE